MNRDIVEVLREGATAYADEVGGGHAYRYTRAADEIERLRAALLWAFDRLSIDDMTKREQQRTMLEIGNVLTGKPSPAASYVPNDWDDSAKLKTATR